MGGSVLGNGVGGGAVLGGLAGERVFTVGALVFGIGAGVCGAGVGGGAGREGLHSQSPMSPLRSEHWFKGI